MVCKENLRSLWVPPLSPWKQKKKDIIKILHNFFNTVANSQINFCWVRTEEKARMLNDF